MGDYAYNIYIYAVYDRKKSSDNIKNYKSDKYGNLCVIFNLIGGFIVFEIFSFAIACFCKLITLNIIIHIPIWWLSMWIAQRILPHVINRIIGIFIKPD